ncbi:MAG: response regulator transcription factor [Lachnospiraceae bacterium]|nr:response regulator transcription factor [Lachnospiraceae bacterium]
MLIYIVEDDMNIREIETYALKNSGYEVESFESGEAFYEAMKQKTPDVILLDVMLPNEDGLSILRNLRADAKSAGIPIMMVTAKTTEIDKVRGLDDGADDYITKPFGIMELVSRVKALLRRASQGAKSSEIVFESVALSVDKHSVSVDNKPCELTYKEFELLRYLMENQGIVLSRDKIMERVWGFDYEGETRTVDMHIKTLRQKLGEAGSIIKTVRNVGYKVGQ